LPCVTIVRLSAVERVDVMTIGGPADTFTDLRPAELAVALPAAGDAALVFIGRIRTPWRERSHCPKRGDLAGPECAIEVFAPWQEALTGIERHRFLEVLYWMHRARRDLVIQHPRGAGPTGTFTLRSPVRPNPIASSLVEVVGCHRAVLRVRGLDCLDGTPLLDLKPARLPDTCEGPKEADPHRLPPT
jgi:tRNA-Thr(GGU) m(6)t(6)A37 methyltransferase TsaA